MRPTPPSASAARPNDFLSTYRALGVRQEDEGIWFWIGTHSDYESLVANL